MNKNRIARKLWLIAASLAAGTLANDCQITLRDAFVDTARTTAQCFLDPFNFGLTDAAQGTCRGFF